MSSILPPELVGEFCAREDVARALGWTDDLRLKNPKGEHLKNKGEVHKRGDETFIVGKAGEFQVQRRLSPLGFPYEGPEVVLDQGTYDGWDLDAPGFQSIETKTCESSLHPLLFTISSEDPRSWPGAYTRDQSGALFCLSYFNDVWRYQLVAHMWVVPLVIEPWLSFGSGWEDVGKKRINGARIIAEYPEALITDLSVLRRPHVEAVTERPEARAHRELMKSRHGYYEKMMGIRINHR